MWLEWTASWIFGGSAVGKFDTPLVSGLTSGDQLCVQFSVFHAMKLVCGFQLDRDCYTILKGIAYRHRDHRLHYYTARVLFLRLRVKHL